MLDDGVSFAGSDGAGTEAVPCGLNVAGNPFLDLGDVVTAVLERIADLLLVGVEVLLVRLGARLELGGPRSVLEVGGNVARKSVGIGGGNVQVHGAGGRVECEVGVHSGDLTGVGLHAAGSLARLDVTPDHGSHVALVVHEASVEVRSLVRVGGGDVGVSTGEGVFQEVEHGEELSRGHQHVVTEPARDDGVVHDGLVGLVLEVRVPSALELGSGPSPHLSKLLLSWADLDTGINTVGGERAGSLDVPLVDDALLGLGVTASEVVEGLGLRGGSVRSEGQVVVLEVAANTWKVDDGLDADGAEPLGVTNSGALEDKRGAESTARDDNLLASTVDLASGSARSERLGGDGGNTDSTAVLDDDLVNLGAGLQVKVVVLSAGAVDVGVGSVGAAAGVTVDPLEPVLSTVSGDEILEIVGDGDVEGLGSTEEVLHDGVGVVSEGNLDRSLEPVEFGVVAGPLVGLELLHERKHVLGRPSLGLEVIEVGGGGTSVHHEVDGASTTEDVRARNNGATSVKPLGWPGVVERSGLGVQLHVARVDTGAVDPEWFLAKFPSDWSNLTKGYTYHWLLRLLSPASIRRTWRLWSRLARRPAGTHPEEPPPQTMMSTSSGTPIFAL